MRRIIMNIKYAVLGLLSWNSFSGYDMKKIFAESVVMHWSGNNNQIYKALVDLHKAGFVSKRVVPQQDLPARKVYSITPEGKKALQDWLGINDEQLPRRSSFLLKLVWFEQFAPGQMEALFERYEYELNMELAMVKEKIRRHQAIEGMSERERFLWDILAQDQVDGINSEIERLYGIRRKIVGKHFFAQ